MEEPEHREKVGMIPAWAAPAKGACGQALMASPCLALPVLLGAVTNRVRLALAVVLLRPRALPRFHPAQLAAVEVWLGPVQRVCTALPLLQPRAPLEPVPPWNPVALPSFLHTVVGQGQGEGACMGRKTHKGKACTRRMPLLVLVELQGAAVRARLATAAAAA